MRYVISLVGVLIIGLFAFNPAIEACDINFWWEYENTQLFAHNDTNTYFFTTPHMAIDADGAPNAYHPDDIGLDYLENSGYPDKSWWKDVLVVDPEYPDDAYVQKSGEFAGYFVSKTSLCNKEKAVTDPKRYTDSRHIPYFVFPGSFYASSGTGLLGDIGIAINLATKAKTAFVVADIGPSKAPLSEVSISLAERLGGKNVNPRNGAGIPEGEILYIIFPYSSREYKWPMSLEEMSAAADELLMSIGDLDSIISCIAN